MIDPALSDRCVRLLAGTDLFRDLPQADLAACAQACRAVRFSRGDTIFAHGDAGGDLYIVERGRVKLGVRGEDGREVTFRHAVEGDLFGEISAFDDGERTASAVALTAVAAIALDHRNFRLLCRRPPVMSAMAAYLCRRLRQTSDQLETIALHSLDVRVARFLLFAIGGRTASPDKRIPLELGFSQSELASLTGASRPKINAALGKLEEAGAIGRTQDRLFCDPAKLRAIAMRDEA